MGLTRVRKRWKVAAVQLTATADVDRNLRNAERLVRRAAAAGAELVALPENFACLRAEGSPIEFKTGLERQPVVRLPIVVDLKPPVAFPAGSAPEDPGH